MLDQVMDMVVLAVRLDKTDAEVFAGPDAGIEQNVIGSVADAAGINDVGVSALPE